MPFKDTNRISVVGFLGCDPVLTFPRIKDREVEVVNFTLYSDNIPYQITAWNQVAKNANQYLRKGLRAWVNGKLEVDLDKHELKITASEIIYG